MTDSRHDQRELDAAASPGRDNRTTRNLPSAHDPASRLSEPLVDAVARITADRDHGASYLAREVARALADATAFALADLRDADSADLAVEHATTILRLARALAYARPSMVILATCAARICAAGWTSGPAATRDLAAARDALAHAHAEALRLIAAWDTLPSAIVTHARPLVRGIVATISRSATVESVLRNLARAQVDVPAVIQAVIQAVIVTESRPGGEGKGLAQALGASGLRVTLVADTALGLMLNEATCVVTGTDSVRADGSVVNKVGTYPLALAARAAGVPCFVVCESLKIAPPDWPLTLEEMGPAELLPVSMPGVTARNPYFDHTPAAFISAIITEHGALDASAVAHLARDHARDLARLNAGALAT